MIINKAFILAAGFGKRLGKLTENTPKPLLKVNGEPLIDRNIRLLREVGITQFYVNTHYLAPQILEHFSSNSDIEVVFEPNLLETGGGILNLFSRVEDDVVFTLNSDNYFDNSDSFRLLLDSYRPYMDNLLLLKKFTDKKDFALTPDMKIDHTAETRPYRYLGASIINRQFFKGLKVEPFSLTKLWFKANLKDAPYYGCTTSSTHFDIGTLEELEELKAYVKTNNSN